MRKFLQPKQSRVYDRKPY